MTINGKPITPDELLRIALGDTGGQAIRCREGEYAITPGAIEPVYGPFSTEGCDWFAGPIYPPNAQPSNGRKGNHE